MEISWKNNVSYPKVGLVILNYLNFSDTIECVESAKCLSYGSYGSYEIIVLDNGSRNNSKEILLEKYSLYENIHVLSTHENIGFAKGNNVGIEYARNELACEFVFVVNNDTIFEDKNIIEVLLESYIDNVGIIGPNIVGRDGVEQNPVDTDTSYKVILWQFIFCLTVITSLYKTKVYKFLKKMKKSRGPKISNEFIKEKTEELVKRNIVLHGAAIMFTPKYFENYSGFYPGTFLYMEENILAMMIQKAGLIAICDKKVKILHKEDMSSTMSFNNSEKIKARYRLNSVYHCLKIKIFGYKEKQGKLLLI